MPNDHAHTIGGRIRANTRFAPTTTFERHRQRHTSPKRYAVGAKDFSPLRPPPSPPLYKGTACRAPTETLVARGHRPTPGIPTTRTGNDDLKDRLWDSKENLERVTRFERATPCLGSSGRSATLEWEPKPWFRLLASRPFLSLVTSQSSCRHLNSRPTRL